MKKAIGIIVYERTSEFCKYTVCNFTIKANQYFVDFSEPFRNDQFWNKPLTMDEIIKQCLTIAKENNYYFPEYKSFGLTFPDIGWINRNNPIHIDKFGYVKKEEE